jgi:transmembrane sensor
VAAYLEVAALWNDPSAHDLRHKWDRQALIEAAAEEAGNVVSLVLPSVPMTSVEPSAPAVAIEAQPFQDPKPQVLEASSRHSRARFPFKLATLAASIAVVSVSAGLYLWLTRATVYSTEVGEQRLVRLMDGSTVELDARTKLLVHFSDKQRSVELVTGQALFQVAKSPERPFVVHSGGTRVRAVGTQFDVYQKGANTVVTVVEGRVAVENQSARTVASASPPGATVADIPATVTPGSPSPGPLQPVSASSASTYLAAGEQLIVAEDVSQKPSHPDVARATAWTHRKIVFEGAYLSEVAQEFNRYSDRQLIIEESAPRELRLSGVFSTTDIGSIIRFLRERPGLEVVETTSEIRIRKK